MAKVGDKQKVGSENNTFSHGQETMAARFIQII